MKCFAHGLFASLYLCFFLLSGGWANAQEEAGKAGPPVHVWFSEGHGGAAGSTVTVPLVIGHVRRSHHLVAFDLDIQFDPAVISWQAIDQTGTAVESWDLVVANSPSPGRILISAANTAGTELEVNQDTTLLLFEFQIDGAAGTGDCSDLALASVTLNDGNPSATTFDGELCTTAAIPPSADLALTQTITPAVASVGDQVTIQLVLSNAGPDIASGLSVNHSPPAGLSYLADTGGGTYAGGLWTPDSLQPGTDALLEITAVYNGPGTITTIAELATANQGDPDSTPGNGNSEEDDYSTAQVRPPSADLSLALRVDNSNPFVGGPVHFTLTLSNDGPDDAADITVAAVLPAGLSLVAAQRLPDGDGSEAHKEGTYSNGTWSLDQLVSGAQAVLAVEARGDLQGTFTFITQVTGVDVPDPDSTPGNNAAGEDDYDRTTVNVRPARGANLVIVNGDGGGEGLNDPTPVSPSGGNPGTTLGEQRLIALQQAADIWASYLISDMDIVIRATFDPLPCEPNNGYLAETIPNTASRIPSSGNPDLWYPVALANTLTGTDGNGPTEEINLVINSAPDSGCSANQPFYYGLDGNPGSRIDLLTVAVGEIARGLGLASFINHQTGTKFFGTDDIVSTMLRNASSGLAWSEMSNQERLDSADDPDSLIWTGPIASAAAASILNGGTLAGGVRMAADAPNFSDFFQVSFNTFVNPNQNPEEVYRGVNHEPGLALEILYDLGWPKRDLADLALTLSVDNPTAVPDEQVTFTLTVTNEGPADAGGVIISTPLPGGFSYVSHGGTVNYNTGNGAWTVGTLGNGASTSMTLVAEVQDLGNKTLVAELTAADQGDPDSSANNGLPLEDDISEVTVGAADLSLTLAVDNNAPLTGEDVVLTITVVNDGPDDVTGVQVTDLLAGGSPALLSYVSDDSAGAYDPDNGLWDLGDLADGASAELNITATVGALASFSNRAQITAADMLDPDSTPANNIAAEDDDASVTVSPTLADLRIESTVDNGRPLVGEQATVTFTLTNDGPDAATNMVSRILISPGLSLVSFSGNGGFNTSSGLWTVGSVGAGNARSLSLVLAVDSDGAHYAQAELTAVDQPDPDSTPDNGILGEDDMVRGEVVTAVADLSVDVAVSDSSANQGDEVVFTYRVANNGPDEASGMRVFLPLADGLTYLSHVGTLYDPGTDRWNITSLPAHSSAELEVTTRVAVAGTHINIAELIAANEADPDSTPGNGLPGEDDYDTVSIGVADLNLNVTVSEPNPFIGDEITLTLTLTDLGPENATGVEVTAPLPVGMTLTSASAPYDPLSGLWQVGTVMTGSPAVLSLIASVDAVGSKTFTAEVSASDLVDPNATAGNGNSGEDDFDSVQITPTSVQGATFRIVNEDQPGVGFNDPTPVSPIGGNGGTTLGQQRLIAFQYAADIWGSLLSSQPSINVRASFTDLTCGSGGTLLGFAGPLTVFRDFPGAPRPNTWYPGSLAQALAGRDFNSAAEILVRMNAALDNGCTTRTWYYGLDATPGETRIDMVTIALHELAHGLGFYTMVDQGGNLFFDRDDIYLTQLEDHTNGKTFPQMSNAERVRAQTNTGNLHWVGPTTSMASGTLSDGAHASGHVEIYAPENFQLGSSVLHFSRDLEPDSLMEPAYVAANHTPGLAFNALIDMGWPTLPKADLRLSQTISNTTPESGEVITIQLTLHNDGPAQSTGIRAQSTLSSGLTLISTEGAGYDTATDEWIVGTLEPGSEAELTMTVRVDSQDPQTHEAEITAANREDPDSEPGNGQVDEDDHVLAAIVPTNRGEADLSLQITVDNPAPLVLDQVVYTLTVTNAGPDEASGVVVRDILPVGVRFESASGDGNFLNVSGNWNVGTIPSGADADMALTVSVVGTGTITNEAEIILSGQDDPDSVPANGQSGEDDQAAVDIVPQAPGIADLSLDLSVAQPNPNVGDEITLHLTLSNSGPDSANLIVARVALPPGLSLVSSSGAGTLDGNTWSIAGIAAGSSADLDLTVTVDNLGTKTVVGEVMSVLESDPDSAAGNNTPAEDDQDALNLVPASADLSLSQTVDEPITGQGDIVRFTLSLINSGPNGASGVSVGSLLPSGLVYQGSSGGTYDPGSGIWDVGNLAVGAATSLNIDARVDINGMRVNIAEVAQADQFDPDSTPGNGAQGEDDRATATVRTSSGSGATILISNADGPGEGFNDPTPVSPVGGNNAGTLGEQRLAAFQHAADIWAQFIDSSVTIVVESNFNPLTCSAGSGILGSAGPLNVSRDFPGAPLANTWYPAALANAITGTDLNGSGGEIRATFNSSIDNNSNCLGGTNWYYGLDGNAGGDIDLVSVLLHEMAHGLGFVSFANAQTGALFYGRTDAYSNLLEDHSAGRTWSNMSDAQRRASAVDGGDLHWTGPNLINAASVLSSGVGQGGHVELFAPNPYQPGSSVSHFSTSLAPNELMEPYYTGPNHDPGLAAVLFNDLGWLGGDRADLELNMAVDNETATPGDTVTFSMTLTNDGPSQATSVRVRNVLPDGFVYTAQSGTGFYGLATGLWTIGYVAAGASVTLQLQAVVQASGNRTAVAEVERVDQPDPDSVPDNGNPDEDDQAVVSVSSADLELVLAADDNTPDEGGRVTLSLTLYNMGPDDADGIAVRALLPSSLALIQSPSGYDPATGTWNVGALTSGTNTRLDLTVVVNTDQVVNITGEVIRANQRDPDSTPGNGQLSEDDMERETLTPVPQPKADLRLSLSVDDGTPTLGELVTFTMRINNDGPNTTGSVVVQLDRDDSLAYVEAHGDGTWDEDNGQWTVPTMARGAAFSMNIITSAESAGNLANVAEVVNAALRDPDSTPGNGLAGEDDQAEVTVVPHPPITNSIIILNADAPGEGFNDPTQAAPVGGNSGTTLGAQRLIAFQYAADIWAALLDINVPVVIEAKFDPLQCSSGSGVLGAAGPKTVQRDFPGAPQADTWYHAALANNLTGYDINGSSPEIVATFNSSMDNNDNCLRGTGWYYGIDANPGNNMDLVAVLLHEFAHGLGFSTLVNGQSGQRFMDRDDMYMRHLEDHAVNKNWQQMSNGERAISAVRELHWTGSAVTDNAAGLSSGRHPSGHVEMFAPNPYQSGSSVSHFSTNLSPNELMEPYYTGPEHDPGLSLHLLRDVGWGEGLTADLSLALEVDEPNPDFGDTLTFSLALTNDGPDEASEIQVEAVLPAGLNFINQSGGYDDGTGLWSVGTLAAGATATLDLQAQVATGVATGMLAQVVGVRAGDPDSTPDNSNPDEDDQASVTVVPTGSGTADLSLTMSVDATQPATGDQVVFTLTLSNDGPDTANGVVVRNVLPTGLTFVSASAGYQAGTGEWSPPSLASGGSTVLSITATVVGAGAIRNIAEVARCDQDDPDSTPANGVVGEDDRAEVSLSPVVIPKADLSLQLTTNTGNPLSGSLIELRVLVRNDGPDVADDVAVAFSLPPDLTLVSHSGGDSYNGTDWLAGTLVPGTEVFLIVEALVETADPNSVIAEISASSLPDPDSSPGNGVVGEDDRGVLSIVPRSGGGAVITILNADSPGEGFNDPTPASGVGGNGGTTLGAQRLIAFQYAADIWAQYLASDIEIVVRSQFNALQCGSGGAILGQAAPNAVFRDFPGAPEAGTWYTAAQANALSGTDQNGAAHELWATFNSALDGGCLGPRWYYGLDANPGRDIDLVTVLVHEMAHGLGFLALTDGISGQLFRGYPDIYIKHLEDHRLNATWDRLSNGQRASSALSGNQLHWVGEHVAETSAFLDSGVNGSGHVEIYAPNPYRSGSSVSHFSTSLSPNVAMEPSYAGPDHEPILSASLFYDIGWPNRAKADLRLDVATGSIGPAPGDDVTFTVTVTNDGAAPTTSVTVLIDQGDGLVYSSHSGDGTYQQASGLWTIGAMPDGTSTTLEVTTTVAASGSKIFRAEVATSDLDDPDSAPGNNQPGEDDQDLASVGVADLSLDLYVPQLNGEPGDLISWSLLLSNEGPDAATGVEVDFPLPAGTTLVNAPAAYSGGLWQVGTLAAGATRSIDVTTRLDQTGTISGTAEVRESAETDPDSIPANGVIGEDDTGQDSIEVTEPAPSNLSVTVNGFYSNNCPNMTLRFQVLADGSPVNNLPDDAFTLAEDGTALSFTTVAVSSQGEYELNYPTPRPDGLNHTIDLSVSASGLTTHETTTALNCHISGVIDLQSGLPVENVGGSVGGWHYYRLVVPANQGLLEISTHGGSGDADLYVKLGAAPALDDYDYRPLRSGNQETVAIQRPQGGDYYIGLHGVQDFSGLTLLARFAPLQTSLTMDDVAVGNCPSIAVNVHLEEAGSGIGGLGIANFALEEDGVPVAFSLNAGAGSGDYTLVYTTSRADGAAHTLELSAFYQGETLQASKTYRYCDSDGIIDIANWSLISDLSGQSGSFVYFRLNVPANQNFLHINTFSGGGDADLYLHRGAPPTLDSFQHVSRTNGNDESILLDNDPQSDDWYIGVYGFGDYQGLSLLAGYGQFNPDLVINSVSVANCPEILVDLNVSNESGPISGLGLADFTLVENNGTPLNPTSLSEPGPGHYQLGYATAFNTGEEVFLVALVDNNGVMGQANTTYNNCARDGGVVQVWINEAYEGLAGTTFRAQVFAADIDSAFNISQFQVALDYDPGLLTYTGYDVAGSLIADWNLFDDSASGAGTVHFSAGALTAAVMEGSGEQVLVSFLFQVNGNAAANTCSQLNLDGPGFRFNDGLPLAELSSGRFCVPEGSCPRALGDLNGDGNDQSAFDAFLILSMVEGSSTPYDPIPLCVADTNCSGDIALMDAVAVLQKAVGLIDDYCSVPLSGSRGSNTFNLDIPADERELGLAEPFEFTLNLDQLVEDPVYGYRFELTYDANLISLDEAVLQAESLTSRWDAPIVERGAGTLTVTHLSPTAPLTGTGTLIKLSGTTNPALEGEGLLTFNAFSLGAAGEPEATFQFTLSISGEPCFSPQEYGRLLSDWGSSATVTDLIEHISCLGR